MEDYFNMVIVMATYTLHKVRDIVRLCCERLSFIVVGLRPLREPCVHPRQIVSSEFVDCVPVEAKMGLHHKCERC